MICINGIISKKKKKANQKKRKREREKRKLNLGVHQSMKCCDPDIGRQIKKQDKQE